MAGLTKTMDNPAPDIGKRELPYRLTTTHLLHICLPRLRKTDKVTLTLVTGRVR